jgi:hypothetical protein
MSYYLSIRWAALMKLFEGQQQFQVQQVFICELVYALDVCMCVFLAMMFNFVNLLLFSGKNIRM